MSYFSGARETINKNRIYSWMIVFIILTQALSFAMKAGTPDGRKDAVYAREQFRVEIEQRQDALRTLFQRDKNLAYNFSVIFIFGLCVLFTGAVFLVSYLKDKLEGKEGLKRTLDTPEALWSIGDVFRAVIFFVFFHMVFSVTAFTLQSLVKDYKADFRLDVTVSTLIMDIMMLLFVLRVVISGCKQGIDALGISLRGIILNIKAGLYLYIAFLPVLLIVLLSVIGIAKLFDYTPPPQPVYELIFKEQRPLILLLVSALIALIGPFIEEVFFRGFLYGAFRKTLGVLRAVLLSSFLFAFLHMSLLGFIPIMFLGVLLAYLRERTGSLVPAVAVHVVHNGALTAMMFMMRELTSKAL